MLLVKVAAVFFATATVLWLLGGDIKRLVSCVLIGSAGFLMFTASVQTVQAVGVNVQDAAMFVGAVVLAFLAVHGAGKMFGKDMLKDLWSSAT